MIALIQRVSHSSVDIENETVASIGRGVLVLLGVEKDDDELKAERLVERVLNYRIFPDDQDKMNLSVKDINGGVLVVSQFTLVADTRKGTRPSFSRAGSPHSAEQLYNHFVSSVRSRLSQVQCGSFGADMKVNLRNDGPVSFILTV